MKLAKFIPFKPKKKSRSLSRSSDADHSFSSHTTSSSSDDNNNNKPTNPSTPTSVLPTSDDLKQAFDMIDRDGDGKILNDDLEALLCGLAPHPPAHELRLMLADLDLDRDGCITLDEFRAIGPAFAPPACGDEVRDTFDFFDSDRDGRITAEELFSVFRTIGDAGCTLEDCRRMISGVDRNGDGFVCFEDFSLMMEQQQLQR